MLANNIEIMTKNILNADRKKAGELFEQLSSKSSYESVFINVFEPALKSFGELWVHDNSISLAQGFISGKIAEDFIAKVGEERLKTKQFFKEIGTVVIGNIEDDFHALGRNIIVSFLKASHFKVIDLGNDVLAENFVTEAEKNCSKIIAVSAMMYSNAMNIKKVRDEINKKGLEKTITLAVGGAIFNYKPCLVKEVGGDCTAPNAIKAVDLFEKIIMGKK